MMTTFGINCPADGRIPPEWVRDHGATLARVVLTAEHDLTEWIAQAHAIGIEVQGVIARESLTPPGIQGAPPPPRPPFRELLEYIRTATGRISASAPLPSDAMSYDQAAAFYVDRYGASLSSLQVGNEPDIESPSSWTMTPDDLYALLRAFDAAFGSTYIIGPGLASGQPSYWESVPDHEGVVDALALHPYGRRPNDNESYDWLPGNFGTVPELLEAYGVFGQEMVISEWGLSTTEVGPSEQAHYIDEMLRQFDRDSPSAPVNILFAADDLMVPEFGLYWVSGQAKPSAGTYVATVNELNEGSSGGEPIMPDNEYGPWQGKIGTGLLDMMKADGTLPAQRTSTWLPLGVTPSDIEEAHGQNGTLYVYHLDGSGAYRFSPGA